MTDVLLHIGYRKAASTFIRAWFHFHPELKIQPVNGFDASDDSDGSLRYFVFSEAFLLFKGNDRPRNIENLQNFQREKCAELKALFPDAKILLITRAPEKCIYSEYSEYIKNGGFNTFDQMKNDPLAQEYFIGHYNYNFVIDLYQNTFGAENMVILPMELLEDQPEQFVLHIEQKLGITHHDFPYHKRNPSRTPRQLWAFRKISLFVWKSTAIFGKKRKVVFYLYMKYLEKESYSNKKLRIPIYLLSFFKKNEQEKMIIPADLLVKMKQNAEILKSCPLYENYLDRYCEVKTI